MVRRNARSSPLEGLSDAEIARLGREIRAALGSLGSLRDAGAVQPVHQPFTGRHAHPHSAFGSQGGDATHAHAHEHHGDADHDHDHAERDAAVGSAERARQARAARAWERAQAAASPAGQARIAASSSALDAAWARLAASAAALREFPR